MAEQHPPTPTDPYAVLGVPRTATTEEIAGAYRRLVRAAHPDSGGDPDRLLAVVNAYRLLRDPKRRQEYDSEHAAAEHPARPAGRTRGRPRGPDIRVGPVRHHPRG